MFPTELDAYNLCRKKTAGYFYSIHNLNCIRRLVQDSRFRRLWKQWHTEFTANNQTISSHVAESRGIGGKFGNTPAPAARGITDANLSQSFHARTHSY
jgi:hypothetical protein